MQLRMPDAIRSEWSRCLEKPIAGPSSSQKPIGGSWQRLRAPLGLPPYSVAVSQNQERLRKMNTITAATTAQITQNTGYAQGRLSSGK